MWLLVIVGFLLSGVNSVCLTPKRTLGECVPLTQCLAIYNIFQQKLLNPDVINQLKQYNCGFENNIPKVCCENGAGPCVTPSRNAGFCVPIRNCETFLEYLEQKPLLGQETVQAIQRYECQYNDQKARICCPILPERMQRVKLPKRSILPKVGQCGLQGSDNRIFGGIETDIYEFPWMALLEYGSPQDPILGCGGSLISSRYVLTAAHCVTPGQARQLGNLSRIRLGEYDIRNTTDCIKKFDYDDCADPPIRVGIEKVIIHEEFSDSNPNRAHDIALIRLSQDVAFTDFIKPICLPPATFQLPSSFIVAGWGQTENAAQSRTKLKLQVPLSEKNRCSQFYSTLGTILGTGQICAGGERGKDSCTGDSGGPLMAVVQDRVEGNIWYQTGIVSFGPVPCGKAEPGVYTLVTDYLSWIDENVVD